MGESLDDAISLVGSRVALVAGPGVDGGFLGRVRKIVHSSDPFGLLVDAMTDAGLPNIPSLACAVTERHAVRLVVRGAGKALVKTDDGRAETLSARGVNTWSEHAFSGVEELVLVAPNAAGSITSLVLFLDPSKQKRRAPKPVAEAHAPLPPVADDIPSFDPPPMVPPPVPPPMSSLPAPTGVPVSAEPPRFDDDDVDLSHLVGDTVHRSVEDAAVRPPSDPTTFVDPYVGQRPSEPTTFADPSSTVARAPDLSPVPRFDLDVPLDGVLDGDHDGNTISVSDLRAVAGLPAPGKAGAPDDRPTSAVPGTGSVVPSSHCPQGHPNAPHAPDCRVCGSPIVDRTIEPVAMPVLGRLCFSDGQVVAVDRPIVVGRQPRPQDDSAASSPRLVTVSDPDQSVSRSHVAVQLEGWEVLVLDLGSMNGTVVHPPGRPPQVLRPGERCSIGPDTEIELGDHVVFRFEATP
jgi:hypothetical protein